MLCCLYTSSRDLKRILRILKTKTSVSFNYLILAMDLLSELTIEGINVQKYPIDEHRKHTFSDN